jgi:hypothetical protein
MKRLIPQLITSVVGVVLVVTALLARPEAEAASGPLAVFDFIDRNFSVWFNILAVFAFILGGASLLKTHLVKIVRRRTDWGYSLVTLVSFVGVLVVGLAKLGGPAGLAGDFAHPQSWLQDAYASLYAPLMASLYSLLAFFVASAAYRAFRLRSLESSVLLSAAVIVLLGRTPLGTWLSNLLPDQLAFLRIDNLSMWILAVPNVAGQRAVLIGIAIGVVALTVRLLAGRDRRSGGAV